MPRPPRTAPWLLVQMINRGQSQKRLLSFPPRLKVDQPGKGEAQEDEGKDMRPHMEVMGAGGQDQGQQQRGQGQAEAGA